MTQTFSFTRWTPTHRSTQHPARCSKPAGTLYVTSQILCEFYSVVTNARRVQNPCSPAAAIAAISSLLAFLRVLPVPTHTVEELIRLLRRRPVTGSDIFDLQILATMNVNGIQRIYTFNAADFVSFREIAVLTP